MLQNDIKINDKMFKNLHFREMRINMDDKVFDCEEAIEIAEGVYWVGYADRSAGFHCNSFLVVDGDEAVLIDSGSRNDFSTVMLKIMRTGTNPRNITRLVYQHYDPDLCGNIPHMEAMIDSDDLKIISHYENNIFIKYYSAKSPRLCIDDINHKYEFSSGRRLEFIHVPYCHAPGNFITYDTKTKVLFSSDIFGAYDANWTFYAQITEHCIDCDSKSGCVRKPGEKCQMTGMVDFHRRIMPTTSALKYALKKIDELDISVIAPQHGSIFNTPESIIAAGKRLKMLDKVGFDCFMGECE